ncbi:MAG: amylo-alpha-1,6-glucosidase [Carbonactinosporaceae bacterium]
MTDAWSPGASPAALAQGTVTLVEGSSFCLCDRSGDVTGGAPQGLFFRDTRILSGWRLRLNGDSVSPLAVMTDDPYHATFVCRAAPRPGRTGTTLLLERRRYVDTGMREDIVLLNLGGEPATCSVSIDVDADFADVFAVKEGRVVRRGDYREEIASGGSELRLSRRWKGQDRGVRVVAEGARISPGRLTFSCVVPARGDWRGSVLVHPQIGGREFPAAFPIGRAPEQAAAADRLRRWRDDRPAPLVEDAGLAHTIGRSREDLAALRIFDPAYAPDPATPVVAAGSPWFMTLFGRDSLLTALMALDVDPGLALGTLYTLARGQGVRENGLTEEEPGRILHEVRFGVDAALALRGDGAAPDGPARHGASYAAYYGTADATPLFVVLLGELHRWGLLADDDRKALLPHADRALDWIRSYGDRDGDGFVEYRRANDRGLANQGWKDSQDAVTFADGRIAEPPIALCEIQGYAYAAYRARARLAAYQGDDELMRRCDDVAARLKAAFNEAFWLPERGWYALALDGRKEPVDSLASNMGHCLWSGIVDDDRAPLVAERLLSPEMSSGWGIRTLATTMGAYNPVSYHNGSVWPHDNALIVAGLMRYRLVEAAQRVAADVLAAARSYGGRLPELMCGFDRSAYPAPVPYPTSCSPQAWAAATPGFLLRTLLGIDPCVPRGRLRVDPALPAEIGVVRLAGLPLGDAHVLVEAGGGALRVEGLPPGVELVRGSRSRPGGPR